MAKDIKFDMDAREELRKGVDQLATVEGNIRSSRT